MSDSAAANEAANQAHAKLAASAGALKASAHVQQASVKAQEDSADRRTVLAGDRTVLAAERTYAAWVRTGLAALAAGVGARALLKGIVPGWLIGITGSVLILFAAFCYVAAVWRQMARITPPRPDTRRLPSWLLILVNTCLTLTALAALIGIWL
jgi:putative membrane protein